MEDLTQNGSLKTPSIMYWARMDSPEKYMELCSESLYNKVVATNKPPHLLIWQRCFMKCLDNNMFVEL